MKAGSRDVCGFLANFFGFCAESVGFFALLLHQFCWKRFNPFTLYGDVPYAPRREFQSANPAQLSKQANPFFILLCGISCELAGCVHRPIMNCRVQDSRLRPNKTLVNYTLAGLAQLSRLSSVSFNFNFNSRLRFLFSVRFTGVKEVQIKTAWIYKFVAWMFLHILQFLSLKISFFSSCKVLHFDPFENNADPQHCLFK